VTRFVPLVSSPRRCFSSLAKNEFPETAGLYVIYQEETRGKGKIRAAPSQWGVLDGLQFRIMENHLAYHGDDNFVKYVGEAFGLKSPAETFGRKWKRPPG